MSRFIVFSDLHFNLWRYGSHQDTDSGNSRLTNQCEFFDRMCNYAAENNIRYALFCGDFFHTPGSIKTEVLGAAWHSLTKMGRYPRLQFVWLVGNHDQADKAGNLHALDFLGQFGCLANRYNPLELEDLPPIVGLDYTEDADKLKRFLGNVPDDSIVLLHQGVGGVEVNSKGFTLNELLTPDMIPDYVLHAFAGHYHSHKRVSDRLTIPGATMQHNWSDAGEQRGFLDVWIDEGQIHIKHVDSHSFKFNKMPYSTFGSMIEWTESRAFVRVTGVPNAKEATRVKKMLYDHQAQSVEIELVEEDKQQDVESDDFDSLDTLFEEFVDKNGIEGRQLEVGKDVIEGKYEAPSKD